MIVLALVVCFVAVSVCTTVVMCNHTRLQYKYERAKLEAEREQRLLGDGR